MTIEEVLKEVIIAIYSSPRLARLLILKGGSAMRMFDNLSSRLSFDADFSLTAPIKKATPVRKEMQKCLSTQFGGHGFDLIDFKFDKKPKVVKEGFPEWWGGWACEFKLVSRRHRGKGLDAKRRYALKPKPSPSPKISIDLSEHEYCGKRRIKTVAGSKIQAYSKEMLVLEKLRAVCQQHQEYPFRQQRKNRARDFYDIYVLTVDANEEFIARCKRHVKGVFGAKDVGLWLLRSLWDDDDFVDEFRRGFELVKNTVSGNVEHFDTYLEHVRFLIRDICPDIPDRPESLSA
jgi:hypothetical protein